MEVNRIDILPMNLDSAGSISSLIKRTLINLRVDKSVIRRVSIATYEAEINVVIHSNGGYCEFGIDNNKLLIVFQDTGAGVKNIAHAMQEGLSTACQKARDNGFGAGMGLPNIKRSSDEFNITSSEDGTTLKLVFYLGEIWE